MTRIINLGGENAPGTLPKATSPETREGLFWVMERALREAHNVAVMLDLPQWVEALEQCRTSAANRREAERELAGIEKLR